MTMPTNNDEIFNLRTLAIERDLARTNLKRETAAAKERFKPSNLVEEAKTKASKSVRQAGGKAIDEIKANPVLSATVAATAMLIAMRRPIARLISNRNPSEPDAIEE
ncbi:MAG: hypothetical protein COA41_13790 [Sphingopyxis sp.]|nr:MAG: hypothetical protein COA41_13790 [Sphingopyxis sp.]